MSNPIKYSTGSESLALKTGNFYIGTGDVGKGPSATTGYYNGVGVPSGGYVIYLYNSSQPGDLSYHTASNDTELISFTNSVAGTSYTTVNECLTYFAGQSDKMVLNRDYEGIVTDGLVFNLDAGFTPSYPKNGTTWYDVSTNTNNGTFNNGPTFSTSGGGSIGFDGSDDYVDCGDNSITKPTGEMTISYWLYGYNGNGNAGGVGTMGGGGSRGYLLGPRNVGTFYFYISSSSTSLHSVTYTDSNLTGWNHIVGIYKPSEYIKLYINGVLVGESTSSIPSSQYQGNGISFKIGNRGDGTGQRAGYVGNVQIYHKSLSSQEVLQNYNTQKGRFGL